MFPCVRAVSLCIACGIMLTSFCPSCADAGTDDDETLFAKIVADWEARERAAKHIEARWSHVDILGPGSREGTPSQVAKGDIEMPASPVRLLLSGKQVRLETHIPSLTAEQPTQTPMLCVTSKNDCRILMPEERRGEFCKTDRALNSWANFGITLPFRGTSYIREKAWSIESTTRDIGSVSCVLVNVFMPYESRYVFWVDMDRQSIPLRCQHFVNNRLSVNLDIQYHRSKKGDWHPLSWESMAFGLSGLSGDRASEVQIDMPGAIPDHEFKLTFPAGTRVVKDGVIVDPAAMNDD